MEFHPWGGGGTNAAVFTVADAAIRREINAASSPRPAQTPGDGDDGDWGVIVFSAYLSLTVSLLTNMHGADQIRPHVRPKRKEEQQAGEEVRYQNISLPPFVR